MRAGIAFRARDSIARGGPSPRSATPLGRLTPDDRAPTPNHLLRTISPFGGSLASDAGDEDRRTREHERGTRGAPARREGGDRSRSAERGAREGDRDRSHGRDRSQGRLEGRSDEDAQRGAAARSFYAIARRQFQMADDQIPCPYASIFRGGCQQEACRRCARGPPPGGTAALRDLEQKVLRAADAAHANFLKDAG